MSYTAVKWAFKQEGLTTTQKLILVRIAESEQDGVCFPKRQDIAQECGVAPESVTRAVRVFEKRGLLTVEKKWKRNRYVLHLNGRQVTTDHLREAFSGDDTSLDNVSQVTTDHLEGDDRSPDQVTTDHLTRRRSTKPSNLDDDDEGARAIREKFLALRDRHWPNHPTFPAPFVTIETEARQFLDAGGTVELAVQHLEVQMPKVAARGRSPPGSLKFFRNSLNDELARSRDTVTFQSKANGSAGTDDSKAARHERIKAKLRENDDRRRSYHGGN